MGIVFFNVGWMEYYQGLSTNDQIQGGGSYVQEEGMGHEVCNYAVHRGIVYGYVQPPGSKRQAGGGRINLERVGAKKSDLDMKATVVWTATRPGGGTVIVGWYKNATVYRYYQEFHSAPSLHKKNALLGYWCKADREDAVLLPVDERTFEIPRRVKGGMGQANVWYADGPESRGLLLGVRALIKGKKVSKKGGYHGKTDPKHNAKVEEAAVDMTWEHFDSMGYQVKSVEKDNVGWDLEAIAGKTILRIEVKGLSGASPVGQLTPNEFKAFSANSSDYRLAIVTNALDIPCLLVCRYSPEKGDWIVDSSQSAKVQIELVQSAIVKVRI